MLCGRSLLKVCYVLCVMKVIEYVMWKEFIEGVLCVLYYGNVMGMLCLQVRYVLSMEAAGDSLNLEPGHLQSSTSSLDITGQLERFIGRVEMYNSSLGDGSGLPDDCFTSADVDDLIKVMD